MSEQPVGTTVRDRAIAAVAAYLNGSDHEVPSHLYVAARIWLDLASWGPLAQLGINLEELEAME